MKKKCGLPGQNGKWNALRAGLTYVDDVLTCPRDEIVGWDVMVYCLLAQKLMLGLYGVRSILAG